MPAPHCLFQNFLSPYNIIRSRIVCTTKKKRYAPLVIYTYTAHYLASSNMNNPELKQYKIDNESLETNTGVNLFYYSKYISMKHMCASGFDM